MTTLRQIITDAFRESGIIAAGDVPDSDEFSESLRRLQAIIKSLIGVELGDNLSEVSFGKSGLVNNHAVYEDESAYVTRNYFPPNTRLIFNNATAQTVYLPPKPKDGMRIAVIDNTGNFATYNITLNGNGRKIESAGSVALATNNLVREWFYRADTGNWSRVTDLTADDESPFPTEFDDYLIIKLALRINPRFGAETKQETVAYLGEIESKFKARYSQVTEMPTDLALLRFATDQYFYYDDPETAFNYGR